MYEVKIEQVRLVSEASHKICFDPVEGSLFLSQAALLIMVMQRIEVVV